MDGYDADADSDTSSVADQRGWPRVIIGQFMYTEQRPNANGGGDTRRFKKPRIYFNTGSQKNRDYFGEKLTKVIEGKKGGVDLSFHETFESFKEAAFDHPSIAQPQINKAKRRYQQNQKKLKRQQNHKK